MTTPPSPTQRRADPARRTGARTRPSRSAGRRPGRSAAVVAAIVAGSVVSLPAAAMAAIEGTAAAAPAPRAACVHQDATVGEASLRELRGSIACLLRVERRRLGVGGVRLDPRLGRAARGQAAEMVRRRFFGHVSPDGRRLGDRLRAARWIPRYGRWEAGEILAYGTGRDGTPAFFVQAWLRSRTHFAVLRDGAFTQIGVGLVRGTPSGAAGLTAAVEFGRR